MVPLVGSLTNGMLLKWTCVILSVFVCASALSELEIEASIEFTELEYEDACFNATSAQWTFINDPTNRTLLAWETAENEYGSFKKKEIREIISINADILNDTLLQYKYNVVEKPGDALLDEKDWKKWIFFTGQAEMLRKFASYVDNEKKVFRDDVERLLSHKGTPENKLVAWSSWHRELVPLATNFSQQLALVRKAAEANNVTDVSQYWQMLSGYPDGYEKIEYMWDEISSLHKKILNLTRSRLSQKYGITIDEETIPAHLLGSLQSYDWTGIAADVIPYANITYDIRKNLWRENFIGKSLYESASSMGKAILDQGLQVEFLSKSQFNQRCPTRLINFCRNGMMGVSACFDTSIGNFLSVHRNVAKILVNQMMVSSTPILNIANRYSGLEEGLAELFAILSVSPGRLRSLNLVDNSVEFDQLRIESLMLTALNVLPRLAYYLSVDLWRMNAIKNNISEPNDLIESWWKYRLKYEGITSSSTSIPTFLDDSHITSNKPYLSKFVGIILAFQLYEYLVESTEVRHDPIDANLTNHNIIKMIQEGGAEDWTTIIKNFIEIDEISPDALLSYFLPLKEYNDEDVSKESDRVRTKHELELDEVEATYWKKINAPSTVKVTTMTMVTPSTTTMTPEHTTKEKSKPKDSIKPKSTVENVQVGNPQGLGNPVITVNPVDINEDDKPKLSTSKAVWAVSAVLVAIVTICVIAIFGRRRCRKTPENRRYV